MVLCSVMTKLVSLHRFEALYHTSAAPLSSLCIWLILWHSFLKCLKFKAIVVNLVDFWVLADVHTNTGKGGTEHLTSNSQTFVQLEPGTFIADKLMCVHA